MRKGLLSILLILSVSALACGDDKKNGGNGGGDQDASVQAECPTASKLDEGEGLMGSCCYRKSNAESLEAPELRLSSIKITAPAALSTAIINGALQNFLDDETFNWLVRLDGLDGDDPTYTTGFGEQNPDASYSFRPSSDEFAPATGSGALADETFSAGPATETIIVPILDAETLEPTVRFALTNLSIVKAALSESRSCVGTRGEDAYDVDSGELTAFVTKEAAAEARVTIEGALDSSLCDLLSGNITTEFDPETACTGDQTEWTYPPDALCGEETCEADPGDGSVCAADECNAWFLEAKFAAQGVEITDDASSADAGADAE